MHDVLVPHLAEKRSNPRKQSGYPAEVYLAEHCIPVMVTVDLNPGSKKCSCVAPRLDTVTETISDCLYLAYSKLLKLTAASNAGVYEKLATLDEYLVDHC